MTDLVTSNANAAGPRVVDVGRRSELNQELEPNGWFAGPVGAPDRFELLGPGLGGGEGITWRARYRGSEETTPLTMAIKQLRRPPGARADWPTPADRQRWDEQKDLLQYLSVDHLATVLDIFVGAPPHPEGHLPPPGTPPETPYVVMEWVPGHTLVDDLGGIPAAASTLGARVTHLQHVAGAVHAVHIRTAYGTIGSPALLRDVKPDNCVLDPARGVVLVDIGTMRLVDDSYEHPGFHHPGYVAPEVLDDPLAPREASADLYSLGALAYFCVLGEDPPPLVGRAGGAEALIGRRLLSAARAARVADPHGFVDHLRLMLHPQPDERPADAVSWARQLRALTVRRRRFGSAGARLTVVAAIAVLGGSALAGVALRDEPGTDPGVGVNPDESATLTLRAAPTSPPPLVTITAPDDDSAVKPCELIEGTSRLPAGRTLVLARQELSGGSAGPAVLSAVDGWDHPASLRVWRTRQRFGSPTSSGTAAATGAPSTSAAAPRYRVDVMVVDLAALKQMVARARAAGKDWRRQALPVGSATAAGITMAQVPGACGTP